MLVLFLLFISDDFGPMIMILSKKKKLKILPLWIVKFAMHSQAKTLCKYTEEKQFSTDTF